MVGRNLRGPLRLPSQHQWSVCRDPNSAHEPILECARASRVRSYGSCTWREIQRRRALHRSQGRVPLAALRPYVLDPWQLREVLQCVFGANYTGMPFNGEDGNNPNLQPATSQSRSIGIVFQPDFIKSLAITVDYSAITLNGFAGGIGFNNILGSINLLGSASPYFSNLGVDNFVGQPGASQPFVSPGQLQAFLTNPGTLKGDPAQANRLY